MSRQREATIACGECFPYAYRFQKQKGGTLVHGIVTDPWKKKSYPHAWVEKSGRVYDWQTQHTRKDNPLKVSEFKEIWNPKKMVTFDKDEAMFAFAHTMHYGPWMKEDAIERVRRSGTMNNQQLARELLRVAADIIEVDFNAARIKNVMKSLKKGDKVAITYYNPQKGGEYTSKYTVTMDWKEAKEAGLKGLHVGIIGRGTPYGRMKGKGGWIQEWNDGTITFQPTWRTQSRQVIDLKA